MNSSRSITSHYKTGNDDKMRKIKITIVLTLIIFLINEYSYSQDESTVPDLAKIVNEEVWIISNRIVDSSGDIDKTVVFFNSQSGDGIAWLKGFNLKNGTIEADIKGKDVQGSSFVGIAFRGVDEQTYDAVYFRPFNFNSEDPVRAGRSVQYISHPTYTWHKLRETFPEAYENPVNPVPDPDSFFHIRIVLEKPKVSVFVNNADQPCLVVNELSDRTGGWVGLWVGNYSDGAFANLKITRKEY